MGPDPTPGQRDGVRKMNIDISDLGEIEQRILLRFLARLRQGMKLYGPVTLTRDKRDMVNEACEEAMDQVWYLGAELERTRS